MNEKSHKRKTKKEKWRLSNNTLVKEKWKNTQENEKKMHEIDNGK